MRPMEECACRRFASLRGEVLGRVFLRAALAKLGCERIARMISIARGCLNVSISETRAPRERIAIPSLPGLTRQSMLSLTSAWPPGRRRAKRRRSSTAMPGGDDVKNRRVFVRIHFEFGSVTLD